MGEKKKFSYTSDNQAAEGNIGAERAPARHRQDLSDIARQTGADRAGESSRETRRQAPPAQADDPFKSNSREETVLKLREQRMQRAGGGEAVKRAEAGEIKKAETRESASAKETEAAAHSKKRQAAAQATERETARVNAAAHESAKAPSAAQESDVSDQQLELVKKMDAQKGERAASEWRGQPAASASNRVSEAAARSSFGSLAPAKKDYKADDSRAGGAQTAASEAAGGDNGAFEEVEEDFGAPKKASKKKTAKTKAAKAKKEKPSAAEKRASQKARKAQNDDGEAKPKKKKGKALAIILCALGAIILLAAGAAALYFTGTVNFFPTKLNTYEAADYETFMKYLTHPSLRAGDTINTSGAMTVDVDAEFGGFVSLPLANLNGVTFENGIVLLLGGAEQQSASLDGVSFNNCEVYIDAEHTDLTWGGVSDDKYINCATLNGSAHLTDSSFPIVGAKMKVSVTLQNSGGALTNAEVTFSSPSYIFTEGETYIVDSIPANSTVAVEVPVIAVEGGRTRIYAHDASGAVSGDSGYVDIVGTGYVSGDIHTHSTASAYKRYSTIPENVEYGYKNGMSFIVSVENYESQDEENQVNEAIWAAEAAIRKKEEEAAAAAKKKEEEAAAAAAAAAGTTEGAEAGESTTPAEGASTGGSHSLPVLTASAPISVTPLTSAATDTTTDTAAEEEEDIIRTEGLDPQYPEKLEQSTVDEIVGGAGKFLQLTGNETGYNNQHMLILKANVTPRSDYGRQLMEYGIWTYQAAVDKVVSEGGIVILPHFFDRDITSAASMVKSLYDETALEIMSGGRGSDSLETRAEFQAWDAINAYGMQRLFAVMASNNFTKEAVGTRYLSGEMGRMTESNIYTMIEGGNYIATNGPTVRFELGGAEMGGMTYVSAEGDAGASAAASDEGADAAEAEATAEETPAATTRTHAKVYACDDSPLTSVRLIRYEMKTVIEDPTPVYVLDVDLTGQGVYEYSAVVDIDARPGEFYRFEARSEMDDAGDDVGVGLSNPIWIYDSGNTPSSTVSAAGFSYKFGGEIVKSANNRWCLKSKSFVRELFAADTTAAYTSVTYHKRDSAMFPDTVTVYMLAPDGKTASAETIYILN